MLPLITAVGLSRHGDPINDDARLAFLEYFYKLLAKKRAIHGL